VKVDHCCDRFPVAALKIREISAGHLAEGVVVAILAAFPQQLHGRRLHDGQACEQGPAAKRHHERYQAAKRVPDQMNRATGLAYDRFQHLRLVGNARIFRRAALGGVSIAEQAGVIQRNCPSQFAITGRQAAAVLHDPGTSTMVGPAPPESSSSIRPPASAIMPEIPI
jgi:hypothetical protein